MDKNEIGIYIHIPFCMKKCFYCDFVSYANKEDMIEKYIKALEKEIKIKAEENKLLKINTIYIGGGTPSFIDSKHIVYIINAIKESFNVKENAEITIEVNPGTVTKNKLEDYIKCGINRISIGLQTTNNELLKQIGRIHTYEQFLETYNLIRMVGFNNINVDLMLALPNQTIKDLEDSLNKVIMLKPEHISVYSLILEEKTKLYDLVESGKLELLDESIERNMYWKVKNILEQNGYKHYEISNFAKEGYESKHNLNCWNQEEYLGMGVAAHSYLNNKRYSNTENLEQYINKLLDEEGIKNDIVTVHEEQTLEDKQKEYMLLGLRKIEGIKISDFKNKFVQNPIYIFRKELDKLVKEDLIQVEDNNIKLTKKGLDLANLVFEEFV
mgnify:FL=1